MGCILDALPMFTTFSFSIRALKTSKKVATQNSDADTLIFKAY